MDTNYINTIQSKTLDITLRIAIAAGLKHKDSITKIANELGFSRQTIHSEIKRGTITQRDTLWNEKTVYDPWAAQYKHESSSSYKGRMLLIDECGELKKVIEENLKNGYSPEIIEQIIKSNASLPHISAKTIYNYLDKGVLEIGNEVLLYKAKKKKHTIKIEKSIKPNGGISIEKRAEIINSRVEFGHWEIDSVVGKRNGKSTSLMTLVERKTRFGIIIKIDRKRKDYIVKAIASLKAKYGKYFYDIFKTITADNGTEFKDAIGMSQIDNKEGKKILIFFAHAYHSWERGTNENFNRMIRRYIPKGTDISKISKKKIKEIENLINNYPRKQFSFKSSSEIFSKELQCIIK